MSIGAGVYNSRAGDFNQNSENRAEGNEPGTRGSGCARYLSIETRWPGGQIF
jgi:hypothetical protein